MSNILGKLKNPIDDNNQDVASAVQGITEKKRNIVALQEPVSAPAKSAKFPAMNPKAKFGDKKGEQRINVNQMTKPLGSFKKGTDRVPKTGMYKVHAGEQVLNKDDAEDMRSSKDRGSEILSGAPASAQNTEPDDMHIQKMDDGSFHIKHSSKGDPEPKQFTARNKKHLVRHVRNTFGHPDEASYEDGGIVQKTGPAMLHKDEAVVPAANPPMMKQPDIYIGGNPKKTARPAIKDRKQIQGLRNKYGESRVNGMGQDVGGSVI